MTKEERRILTELCEATELLSEFGLRVYGYEPGVTAYFAPGSAGEHQNTSRALGVPGRGCWGEPISLSRVEWGWLKPLLEELREFRRSRRAGAS